MSSAQDKAFELVFSVGEECQTESELHCLLERKPNFILYDGFEPSGRMHIAQGVFKSINVNKCTKAGGTFLFWVADWFALMNDKMGGDLEKIKTVGQYLIEVWKAGGMDMSRVKFLWSSDEISRHAQDYWGQALDIARCSTLARIQRCCQIMGRQEGNLTCAQILYPIMQCTDIFFLKADICQLGVDQRKVNMLAREYCDAVGKKFKPIILSHHMLYGLKAGQSKMSKSDPDSAIFMEDSREDVERKIRNAYCPTQPEASIKTDDEEMHLVKDDLKNPVLDYVKYILFTQEGFKFKVGNACYENFETVKKAFVSGAMKEDDLKTALIAEINNLLEPVRRHFEEDAHARSLLEQITAWKKTNLEAPNTVTKLDLLTQGKAPLFAVFAPLPQESVEVEAVLGVVERLKRAPKGTELVLFLEDWSAVPLGRLGGSAKLIKSFYNLLLHGLHTLAPQLMKDVKVIWQGEAILSGPSEYWISVINAGRRIALDTLKNCTPEGETLHSAGQVVASLMHVGDVFAISAHKGERMLTLCCDSYHENLHKLAADQCKTVGIEEPTVEMQECPKLRLMQPGEGVDADVTIYVTDSGIEVNKKIKKAYCELGNTTFSPLFSWASILMHTPAELVITRKPDNGGDKSYKNLEDLQTDLASGALHPGDFKPAMSKAVNSFLEQVRFGLKESDVLKKAEKELETYIKALKKK